MPVFVFNQIDLPVSFPFLDLLLSAQRRLRQIVNLEPNRRSMPYRLVIARHDLVLVLPNTPGQIGCGSDIEGAVRPTGEQIPVKHRA